MKVEIFTCKKLYLNKNRTVGIEFSAPNKHNNFINKIKFQAFRYNETLGEEITVTFLFSSYKNPIKLRHKVNQAIEKLKPYLIKEGIKEEDIKFPWIENN